MLQVMKKEEVRDALIEALSGGYTMQDVATATGLPLDSLKQFRYTGYLGAERVEKIAAWLESLEISPPAGEYSQEEICELLARDLLLVVDALRSKRLPFRFKQQRVHALFAGYRDVLEEMSLAAAEERPKYGSPVLPGHDNTPPMSGQDRRK